MPINVPQRTQAGATPFPPYLFIYLFIYLESKVVDKTTVTMQMTVTEYTPEL